MVAMADSFKSRPQKTYPDSLAHIGLYVVGWDARLSPSTVQSLVHSDVSHTLIPGRLPASLGCSHWHAFTWHVFPSTVTTGKRWPWTFFFYWPTTQHYSMSKDNRHDGRRRGAGQHRLGPRSSQGGDGRERSGSNSSGSSHGGGKSKNPSLSALKVREE